MTKPARIRLALGTLVTVLLLLPSSQFIAPRPAKALIPVHDAISYIINGVTAHASGSLAVKEYALDTIAWKIARIAILSIEHSTLNWINSGFQGSPAFATDLKATILDAADQSAERLVHGITSNLSLNLPFQNRIARDVLAAYYVASTRDAFFLRNPYTLNQVSSDDVAFLRGDFTKGGFSAWFAATLRPESNTPIGFRELVQERLDREAQQAAAQLHEEYQVGGGFLSYRKCDEEKTEVTLAKDAKSTLDLTSHKTCLQSHIVTPGSFILEGAKKAGLSGIDQLVTADELNEIIGALIGQLMNKVLGPSGLAGISRPSAAGGRSFLDQATDAAQYTNAPDAGSSSSLLYMMGQTQVQVQGYKENWQKLKGAAEGAKIAVQAGSCSNKDSLVANEIEPVITRGTQAIAKADTILGKLSEIQSTYLAGQTSGSTAQTSAEAEATAAYDTLLADVPSSADLEEAQRESNDSGEVTADSPESLFSKMNRLAKNDCAV